MSGFLQIYKLFTKLFPSKVNNFILFLNPPEQLKHAFSFFNPKIIGGGGGVINFDRCFKKLKVKVGKMWIQAFFSQKRYLK